MGKIKCYLLILNLVISIFAFSSAIGLVSAQEPGEGGLHTYPGSPIVYKDKSVCKQAIDDAKEADKTFTLTYDDCKPFNLDTFLEANDGKLTKDLQESFEKKENWEAATKEQRKNYWNKKVGGSARALNDPGKSGFRPEGDDIVFRGKKVPIKKFNKYLESKLKEANKGRENKIEKLDILFKIDGMKVGVSKEIGFGKRKIRKWFGYEDVSLDDVEADFKKYEDFKGSFFGKLLGGDIGTLLIVGGIGIALFFALSGKGKSKSEKSGNGGVKTEISDGAGVAVQSADGNTLAVVSSNEDGTTGTVETTSETSITANNVNVEVENQVAASIPSADTQVVLQGIPGDDPSNQPSTDTGPQAQLAGTIVASASQAQATEQETTAGTDTGTITTISLPLLKPTITGKQIANNIVSSQSLVLNNHNLGINGHDINAHALKTFNNLEVGGQRHRFSSGKFSIHFFNQKTYAPTTFSNIDHGVKVIANILNPEKTFELKKYTNKKGQLVDYNNRVSFGDIVTEYYPTGDPREKLIASNQREEMLEIYT